MRTLNYALSLTLCLIIAKTVMSQCTPVLPSSFYGVPFGGTDTLMPSPDVNHYQCDNSTFYYYDNNPDTIFMEGSARLTVGGSTNLVIYMKNNCQLINDTSSAGIKHVTALIYDPAFTTFVDTAGITFDTIISCPGLAFDYSNHGGASPCATLGTEDNPSNLLTVYPNPVIYDNFQIAGLQPEMLPAQIEILDMSGRMVMTSVLNGPWVNITSMPSGIYLVNLRMDNGEKAVKKIIIR